jgi:hypothetical protein
MEHELDASQSMAPLHVSTSTQRTSHFVPLHPTFEAQARSAVQSIAHVEASQVTAPLHVSTASQATLQDAPLHAIAPWQLRSLMQLMLQDDAFVQSISPVHESAFVQLTMHGTPAGHTMGPHAEAHSIVQPPSMHDPPSGQTSSHFGGDGVTSSVLASMGGASVEVASTSASREFASPASSAVAPGSAPVSSSPHATATLRREMAIAIETRRRPRARSADMVAV